MFKDLQIPKWIVAFIESANNHDIGEFLATLTDGRGPF
jgi:hypothetical protein